MNRFLCIYFVLSAIIFGAYAEYSLINKTTPTNLTNHTKVPPLRKFEKYTKLAQKWNLTAFLQHILSPSNVTEKTGDLQIRKVTTQANENATLHLTTTATTLFKLRSGQDRDYFDENMAFANPEDGATMKIKPRVDDKVERIRRAHLNDLENISVFYVIGFIYTLTNPSVAWATLLFRVFTAARFIHTFVYAVFVVPQPARALSWATGFLITGYMAFKSIMHFL
ncbi:unnamed protein product [Tenebrio molitor]|nr:unnamed protein product [Tenebrio molitor]